ncbi:hypothetical protein PAXINDRAFT_97040 [Paxillus involutus ATCC 200175]|nr:hypothetical protein PAXINDRAFT_97040 [Paxillus involutus ATCC 200175]
MLLERQKRMKDTVGRRESCFGEAGSKLQKMDFARKANLPRCTDTLLSTSHGPNTPDIPSMSSSYHTDDLRREPDIPKDPMTADEGPHIFVSSIPYLDGNLYVDPPDGVRRGLVRMKRVARRRPVICSVDLPQLARQLSGQREAGGGFAAEFRGYIEAIGAETTRDRGKNQRPSPSPVDDGWKEVENRMLALDADPSIDINFNQRNPKVNRPSPSSTSKLLDSPALCKRCSPTMPQELDVALDGLPESIDDILGQYSNGDPRPSASHSTSADWKCARPLHEDVLRAYQALQESEALPDCALTLSLSP